jgi:hypothetical protein
MPVSHFTYADYRAMLTMIHDNGYVICDYHNYADTAGACILRHDIDFDVEKALRMAELEAEVKVKSTYFVLLNTPFYNVCADSTLKMIKEILSLGHEAGLHYDETQCDGEGRAGIAAMAPYGLESVLKNIRKEIHLLEQIIERPVTAVSMHRPSRFILDADISIPGVVNSYSGELLSDFKYLSDSRHNWRENVEEVIQSRRHKRLHILTHPFWYTETRKTCREKLYEFITRANRQRYQEMRANFRNLEEFIKQEEI